MKITYSLGNLRIDEGMENKIITVIKCTGINVIWLKVVESLHLVLKW